MKKKFDQWIAENYRGLSAHTLFQFLCSGLPSACHQYWNNVVYVELFHVFCGIGTPEEKREFDNIWLRVNSCEWL